MSSRIKLSLLLAMVAACQIRGHYVGIDSDIDGDIPIDTPMDGSGSIPISSGQFADLVIGQNNFSSDARNSGGQSASSSSEPESVASDGNRLWIAEGGNARVLQWNMIPVIDRPIANVVIGQANATASVSATTQTTIRLGRPAVFSHGGRVFVADGFSNRVLVFSPVPNTNGAPAVLVLGQSSFSGNAGGTSASALDVPMDVWTDGVRLVLLTSGFFAARKDFPRLYAANLVRDSASAR